MSDEEQEKKGFRVVDKRRFNSEGETRTDVPERPDPPPAAAAPAPRQPPQQPQAQRTDPRSAPPQQHSAPADEPVPQRGSAQGGIDFISFVASLATNALAALGALPEARAQGVPVSLEMAREYIEIIAMLHDKTRGNLSREEESAMQRVMSELRMVYVEVTQRIAKPPKPGK